SRPAACALPGASAFVGAGQARLAPPVRAADGVHHEQVICGRGRMASNGRWTRRGALAAATGAAAACGTANIETPAYAGAVGFNHGVASGDPTHDRVVIWTRVSPEQPGPVPVRWIGARNRELTD